jgi:hypothetical protein
MRISIKVTITNIANYNLTSPDISGTDSHESTNPYDTLFALFQSLFKSHIPYNEKD